MSGDKNRIWILKNRPHGNLSPGDLEFEEHPLKPLDDGEVRIRTIYLSLDPTNRIWMSDQKGYIPPVGIGDGMRGSSIGMVVESKAPNIPVGAIANVGLGEWADYNTKSASEVSLLPTIPGLDLAAFMGPLGATGLTAYFGMEIAKPKAGDTLVVSAAAGAVGSIVGQIGKIHGCHVVGIAGADEKCKWLKNIAGFDATINYKTEDVGEALDQHCPKGIDINFENVGGRIMDEVLGRMNPFSRMPLCGLISSYNDTKPNPGPFNFPNILISRIMVQGFIILDYVDRFPEGLKALSQWLMEGKIKYESDIVDGLENAAPALDRLFTGQNLGKLMVRVSDPD